MLLENKVDKKFGTEWGSALLPLLDRFIGAFDGEIDCLFWNSMIKRGENGSGNSSPSYLCGWFNILFPFMSISQRNISCVPYSIEHAYVKSRFTRGDEFEYPLGLSQAPVVWNYNGNEMNLEFIAGFNGYLQDRQTLEICPNLGWCIAHSVSERERIAADRDAMIAARLAEKEKSESAESIHDNDELLKVVRATLGDSYDEEELEKVLAECKANWESEAMNGLAEMNAELNGDNGEEELDEELAAMRKRLEALE